MKKRLLSIIFTLVTLLTLVPATAFAAVTDVPSGYTKVDYIESDGTGYVDTGWKTSDASESYAYEITFAPNTTSPAANGTIFGAWSNISGVGGRIGMIALRSKGTTRVAFGSTSAAYATAYWNSTTDKQTAKVTVDVKNSSYVVTKDGVAVTGSEGTISGSSLCDYSAYVFMTNRAGSAVSGEATAAKVYGLKCWTDGVLVRDFVPCVSTTTGVAGLYDLVNEKFHGAPGGAGVYSPAGPLETTVKFTTPSDVVLSVSKGFALGPDESGAEIVTKTSAVTEGNTTTHTYTLSIGAYRFLAKGENSVKGSKIEKYYNWDKNFAVSYADVLSGGKTINADPGLLAGTRWEQDRTDVSYYVRQFTDEVLNNEELSGVSAEVRAKYPHVFTTPSFSTAKARHEYTTHEEIRTFLAERDAANAKMYVYEMGKGTGDMEIWAAFFTNLDLTGMTMEQAAAALKADSKPTVQVQAQVHGDEQSGTEGALATINTLCNDATWADSTLEKLNVVVLPRMNPWGSKIYQYTSTYDKSVRYATNFNRDYMKAGEVETNMLLSFHNMLRPEIVIDLHEFRPSTQSTSAALPDSKMAVTDSLNLPESLVALAYEFVDYETQELPKAGLRLGYYRDGATDTSPVNAKEYYSDRGSVGILFEIPGQRKGKQQWDRRILSQFLSVKNVLDYTATNADEVKATVTAARAEMANYGKTFDESKKFVTHHVAGDKIYFANPIYDLVAGTVSNADNVGSVSKYNKADESVAIPMAYVIPKNVAKIDDILSVAAKHGITYSEIDASEAMELRQYKNYYRQNNTAGTAVEEGVELGEATLMSFDSGAYVFPVAQESSVVLMLLMEPNIRDASKNEDEWHKSSFVQQGLLTAENLYRCENIIEHEMTFVAATPATCDTDGCTEHWICTCGKGFASNEHANALEDNSWVLPKTGHNFAYQSISGAYAYVCTNDNCGLSKPTFVDALDACDGVGGKVTVGTDVASGIVVVPAGVTLDMNGGRLTPEKLTVNEGGKIVNGSLYTRATSTVNLGSNGGYVPVYTGKIGIMTGYEFYPIETKVGQQYTLVDGGVKYAFGYKYADHAAYAASVTANEAGLKFGVALDLDAASADYSFTSDSVAKMTEVADAADSFYRVNLSIVGEGAEDVTVTPYVKLPELGFRYEGEGYTMPKTPVAEFNGTEYTSLEKAIAAAEAVGAFAEVKLLNDITYTKATTIKLAGTVRLLVEDGKDITVSGPVTFDGQNNDAQTILFWAKDTAAGLTLDGVTVKNYHVKGTSDNNKYYGAVVRTQTATVMKNVTVENCSSQLCGGVYVTTGGTLELSGSTFTNNAAGSNSYGGALSIHKGATVTVKDCTFTGNSAGVYGGAIGVREGTVMLENVTMSGNLVGSDANDLHVKSGGAMLDGSIAIDAISLEAGMMLTTGNSFALATGTDAIVLDATKHEQVLTGSNVADDCTAFVGTDGTAVDTEGYLGGAPTVVYTAEVDGTKYTSLVDAVAAANALTDSTVYLDLIADEHFDTATTATFDPNVRIRVQQDVTLSGKLTIDGGSVAHTTNPLVLPAAASSDAGCTLTLQGVTLRNCIRDTEYGAMFRIEAYNKVVLDGATVENCSGGMGVAYVAKNGSLEIKNNSVISNNSATHASRGLIYLDAASCSFVASDSTFSNNTGAGKGSVACMIGKKSSVTNCTFEGNTGALGVIHMRYSGTLPIDGCTFTNNTTTATNGAAIYSVAGTTTVTNSTFTGNTRNVYVEGGTVTGVSN